MKFGKSLGLADRLKARHAVILGEDELAAGVVTVKRLADGTQQKLAEPELFSYLRAASAESCAASAVLRLSFLSEARNLSERFGLLEQSLREIPRHALGMTIDFLCAEAQRIGREQTTPCSIHSEHCNAHTTAAICAPRTPTKKSS